MQKIHLIRHSITEASKNSLMYGSTDLPIIPEGEQLILQRKMDNLFPSVDENCHFYTSGMRRAETTLRLAYGDVVHKIVPDLSEYNFGKYELTPYNKDSINIEELAFLRLHTNSEYITTNKDVSDFIARIKRGLNSILSDTDNNAVAVCHSGTIATLMMMLFSDKPTNLDYWFPAPCEGYTLLYENKKLISYTKI